MCGFFSNKFSSLGNQKGLCRVRETVWSELATVFLDHSLTVGASAPGCTSSLRELVVPPACTVSMVSQQGQEGVGPQRVQEDTAQSSGEVHLGFFRIKGSGLPRVML